MSEEDAPKVEEHEFLAAQRHRAAVNQAMIDVFNTESGKLVLDDLLEYVQFSKSEFADESHLMVYNAGQRSVLFHIAQCRALGPRAVFDQMQRMIGVQYEQREP